MVISGVVEREHGEYVTVSDQAAIVLCDEVGANASLVHEGDTARPRDRGTNRRELRVRDDVAERRFAGAVRRAHERSLIDPTTRSRWVNPGPVFAMIATASDRILTF